MMILLIFTEETFSLQTRIFKKDLRHVTFCNVSFHTGGCVEQTKVHAALALV